MQQNSFSPHKGSTWNKPPTLPTIDFFAGPQTPYLSQTESLTPQPQFKENIPQRSSLSLAEGSTWNIWERRSQRQNSSFADVPRGTWVKDVRL